MASGRRRWVLAGTIGLVAAVVPTLAQAAGPPSNDGFSQAAPLSLGARIEVDTTDATTEATEPQPSCSAASRPVGHTVWYRLDLAEPSVLAISSAASKYDTVLSLWSGPSIDQLSEKACSDDDVEAGTLQASIDVLVDPGTYYLQAAGWDTAGGLLRLRADRSVLPVNDRFANAIEVTGNSLRHEVDLTRATLEPSEPTPCYPGSIGASVWYRVQPAVAKILLVETTVHHVIGLYSGTSLGDLDEVGCSDWSPMDEHLAAGVAYWLQLGIHDWDADGDAAVSIDLIDPPVNDEIENALPIRLSESLEVSTVGTREATSYDPACDIERDVWYRFTPEKAGSFLIDVNPNRDYLSVELGVYTETAVGLTQLFCTSTDNGVRTARFAGVPGTTYFVRAGTRYGTGSLTIWLRESSVA